MLSGILLLNTGRGFKMKITPKELLTIGKWLEYCELTNTNRWALSEGLVEYDTLLDITVEQFKELIKE